MAFGEDIHIIEKAFRLLFPGKEFSYSSNLKYSGHFKDYGATISLRGDFLQVKLSKSWQGISSEIQIGLIQELLLRMFKKKFNISKNSGINMFYIDLYNSFVKNLHKTIPKEKINPFLKESFDRVNEKYFYSMVEMPNLVLASYSTTKFGTYNYKSDTISITETIIDDQGLLDYVMYHEMLHKKHSFKSHLGSNRYHTSQFRKAEKIFENSDDMEKRLRLVASKNILKRNLGFSKNPFSGRLSSQRKKQKGFFGFFKNLLE